MSLVTNSIVSVVQQPQARPLQQTAQGQSRAAAAAHKAAEGWDMITAASYGTGHKAKTEAPFEFK